MPSLFFCSMRKQKFLNSVMSAVWASVIALISQIIIPSPFGVPFTLQTLAIALCGYTLGIWQAVAAVAVWLCVGFVGLPVFSGFNGGAAALFGATGGFLWGFLVLALFCSLASKQGKKATVLFISFIGLIICHILGVLQFSAVSGVGLKAALITVTLPYIIKDCFMLFLALFLKIKFFKIKMHF